MRRAHVEAQAGDEPTREFALSAVIELIARTAIRPGNESYARLNGTRGATTLHLSPLARSARQMSAYRKGGTAM